MTTGRREQCKAQKRKLPVNKAQGPDNGGVCSSLSEQRFYVNVLGNRKHGDKVTVGAA